MVPLRPTAGRICRYGKQGALTDSNVLTPPQAAAIAADTNRLSVVPSGRSSQCPPGRPTFVIEFADATERTTIVSYRCGAVVNGALVAPPTTQWFTKSLALLAKPSTD